MIETPGTKIRKKFWNIETPWGGEEREETDPGCQIAMYTTRGRNLLWQTGDPFFLVVGVVATESC